MVRVRVRVRVRRNAEPHNSAGQKVGKLEVLEESKKVVDNGCRCGPVACFVLRVVGTHQYSSAKKISAPGVSRFSPDAGRHKSPFLGILGT